jgi:3-deoxy-D-manno-octulosonic-acid transferase
VFRILLKMSLLFLLYDLIFFVAFILYLPLYIWRKKINFAALREKFTFFSCKDLKNAIWIQVVSVGEVNVIAGLIHKLKEVFNYPIVITTTTLTGNRLAKKKYGSLAQIFFFPFDISLVLEKAIKMFNPKIFIAVETEIWPNLFYRLNKKGIPVVIVNGRISARAFKRYQLIKPVIRKVLNLTSYVGVQNAHYKDKFLSLGCDEKKIAISGNMKFDSITLDEKQLLRLRQKFYPILKNNESLLIVCGSTHNPEEEIILGIFKSLIEVNKRLTLLIAPRHVERIVALEKTVSSLGFNPIRLSQAQKSQNNYKDIFLLDTIGELFYIYALADICFVGGSLANYGGHNILEPIYFLKPTIFGPHMDNFKDIAEIILEKGAGIAVKDNLQLKEVILALINDAAARNQLRLRCLDVFEEERKSLDESLKIILKCLQ